MTDTHFDYTIAEFPAQPSREDWRRFHAFRRARHQESRPEDPIMPDDLAEKNWLMPDEFQAERRLVVRHGDDVVGALDASWMQPGAPGYDTNKQFIYVNGRVLAPHRRRGIGTALAREALRLMEDSNTTVLGIGSEEADGHAFLNWLGAEARMEAAENRLDLHAVDWSLVDRWVAEGRARNPKTELVFLEHRVPGEWLERVCSAMSDMLNTIPFDDLEHGEIVITPELYTRQFNVFLDNGNGSNHTYLTLEPDGAISGITDVTYMPAFADRVNQMFTGVRPEHRGRGLGKWLKAAMLQYIRKTYPDARWVVTGNANSNDPMLGINRKLGFKTHRGATQYQMGRDALAQRLAAL